MKEDTGHAWEYATIHISYILLKDIARVLVWLDELRRTSFRYDTIPVFG